jgi:hypothetical protein
LATLLSNLPNATIVMAPGASGNGTMRLTSGYASAAFNTNIDNFTIGISGASTTFDFEPAAAVPEPSTVFAGVTSLLISLGAYARRRRG